MEENFFSERGAADYCGLSYRQLQYARSHGRIRGARVGNAVIYSKEQLDDYLANDRKTDIGPGRYNLQEAVDYLGVSEKQMQDHLEAGRIRGLKVGGILFDEEQLDELAANGRTDKDPEIPFFSVAEAARLLDIERGALDQHIHVLGNLPAELAGNTLIVTREDLEAFRSGDYRLAVLTEDEVREIRKLYATGDYSWADLAERFGVTRANIGHIIHRATWKDVNGGGGNSD